MLSINKIKLIRSLDQKKNRMVEGLFVAEGKKMVLDLVKSNFIPFEIFCTEELANEIPRADQRIITTCSKKELERISTLKSTPDIIALLRIPERTLNLPEIKRDLLLVLDSVQDPGNLGTIIRTADWFGIGNIICSEDTVDLYNSKVVQSTMGAIGRVNVYYLKLDSFLAEAKKLTIPIYGTFMEGENIYRTELSESGIVIMGNEGKGISKEIMGYIDKRITIPSFPSSGKSSESLNVAVATSIICAEFRRRFSK